LKREAGSSFGERQDAINSLYFFTLPLIQGEL
jgi:hypothetical protein